MIAPLGESNTSSSLVVSTLQYLLPPFLLTSGSVLASIIVIGLLPAAAILDCLILKGQESALCIWNDLLDHMEWHDHQKRRMTEFDTQ